MTDSPRCCPIVELRQYTLRPGGRDFLIDLFDREFVETQEAVGMTVIGQFRDLDDPDRFVFLRGFRDMPSRLRALTDFYGGPVWKAHRDAANPTMIDWSNVLLLRPALPESDFSLEGRKRPAPGASAGPEGLIVSTVAYLNEPPDPELVGFFESAVRRELADAGGPVAAVFVTESSPNDYPALPVREGEPVLAWFSRFDGERDHRRHLAALSRSRGWEKVSSELHRRLREPLEVRRLSPTPRSLLR